MNNIQQKHFNLWSFNILLIGLIVCSFHLSNSQQSHHNPLSASSFICLIQNCLQCDENMPYTCKNCQFNKTCCSSSCLNCPTSNPTVCLQCSENHIFNATSKACVLQNSCNQSRCTDCKHLAEQCQACDAQFLLNPFTLTCIPCLEGCSLCNFTLDCQKCKNNRFLKNEKCQECNPICQGCETQPTRCLSCFSGMYWENYTCLKCMEHCMECSERKVCEICQTQHYFDNKTQLCELCGQYCLSCKSVTNCTQCQPFYYLNTTTKICYACEEYIPGCQQCIEMSSSLLNQDLLKVKAPQNVRCLKCQTGFMIFSFIECRPCIAHCSNCSSQLDCDKCENGYVYNQNTKKCVKCQVFNCLICKTPTYCLLCSQGFFWNNITNPEYPSCQKCRTGCSSCGINYCNVCENGYYLANNTCLKCNSQCIQCMEKPDKCNLCQIGYFAVQNSFKCFKCPQNCLKCSSKDYCTDCAIGYGNQNKTCIKCTTENCGLCQKNQPSSQICLLCKSTYILKNNTCANCPQGCSFCPQQTKCITCVPGYYYEAETSLCKKCQQNCIQCTIDTTWHMICVKCQTGFYIDQIGHCLPCSIPNCLQCEDKICLYCLSGFYYPFERQQCRPCPKNCTQCIDDYSCISCAQGFYLENFNCTPCASGCQLCQTETNCISCSYGFRLDQVSSTCQTCKTVKCASCKDDLNVCNQCYPGYVLQNLNNQTSLCFKCGQNLLQGCKSCLFSNSCTECITGYELNEASLCQAQNRRIWPYVLSICILAAIILLASGLKLRSKIKEGKSLQEVLKIGRNSVDPENYHKLEEISIN